MENPSKTEKNGSGSIIKWIDNLAKIIVVITALLYIIGRSYTESYYSHMGIPTSNLPLAPQEYLFMSTKSLSILQNILSASLISLLIPLATGLFGFAISAKTMLTKTLRGGFSKERKKKKQNEPISNKSNEDSKKVEIGNKGDVEISKTEKDIKKTSTDKDTSLEFQSQLKNWIKSKLVYIISTFTVLFFLMLLIPSAQASGGIDSEYAIQNAPLGRILLNQPSIPELTPKVYNAQKDAVLYDYGMLPVAGMLGENYLLVLENQNSKKSILSIPVSSIVSINYVSYISLTPMPTSSATPTITPLPTDTATPSPTP